MAEKSLDIIINARDHASKQLGMIGKSFQQMQRTMMGITGAVTAIRVGVGLAGLAMESFNLEQAIAKGEAIGIYEAQLKVIDATNDLVRSIPFVGHAISSALKKFGDREHIEQAIANIKEVAAAILQTEKLSGQWRQETELRKARLFDATESEMMAIRNRLAAERRDERINETEEKEALARKTMNDAVIKLQDTHRTETTLIAARLKSATEAQAEFQNCLLYTSPSPRDATLSRMPSSA